MCRSDDLDKAMANIDKYLSDYSLKIPDIAKKLNVNSSSLRFRLVAMGVDLTARNELVIEHIRKEKWKRTKTLLDNTDMTIAEIAEQVQMCNTTLKKLINDNNYIRNKKVSQRIKMYSYMTDESMNGIKSLMMLRQARL
jgi:hypothetical protein